MVHRPRPAAPPKSLASGSTSAGGREREKVLAWINAGRTPAKDRPDFSAYKRPDVVAALEALFFRKCAYCESPYAASQPVDVEHWRPKAEVNIKGQKDPRHGYEWLAMEWTNLLPSCIDCNRARGQSSLVEGVWKDGTQGKANQFPVRDETRRHAMPDDVHDEQPLLLDPCADKPEHYFDFDESGVVLPRLDLDADQRLRAEASIIVYALNRRALVDERVRHLRWLELEFRVIRFLFKLSGDTTVTQDIRDAATALVEETLDRLRQRMETSEPYSAFLARRIRPFLEKELGAA